MDNSTFDQFTGEKRENFLKFQVTNKNIEKLQNIPVGAIIKVTFGIRGRFFDGTDRETGATKKMHGQNLDAYGFEVIQMPPQEQPTAYAPAPHEQNSYRQPAPPTVQQPQQTAMLDAYGNPIPANQAPANQQDDDDLPF